MCIYVYIYIYTHIRSGARTRICVTGVVYMFCLSKIVSPELKVFRPCLSLSTYVLNKLLQLKQSLKLKKRRSQIAYVCFPQIAYYFLK